MSDPRPRALADLAESLRHVGASAAVEQALEQAWHDMHENPQAAAPDRRGRGPLPLWVWPALGLAATVAVALRLGPAAPRPATPTTSEAVVAVPGGPLEPPRARVPEADAAVSRTTGTEGPAAGPTPSASARSTSPRRTPRGRASTASHRAVTAGPALAAVRDEAEPFVWIRGADEIEPGLGLQIVRVQLPRVRWDTGTPRREFVNADVLMGNDGQPRAVRVVQAGLR